MKNKLLPFLLLASVCVFILSSCTKKREQFTGDYSKNYYPLNFGKTIIYDVDSTIWDDVFCTKTIHHYQVRRVVSDTFRDEDFRLSYRIDTDIRKNDSLPWESHRVMLITPTETSLEYVEENLRFIKMVFPVQNGATWDGNAKIPYSLDDDLRYFAGWDYYYDKFSQPFNNGFVNFENTVTVNAVNDTTSNPELYPNQFADKRFAKEVYAQGVGMVYREVVYWTYQPSNGGPATGCRKGYGVVMRAIDHN